MRTPDESTEEAIKWLRTNDRFHVVLNWLVEEREAAIGQLGIYKDDASLRKDAAEITVITRLLDVFGLPTGTVKGPAERMED